MVALKLLNVLNILFRCFLSPFLSKFLWLIIKWDNYFPGSLIFISSFASY